MKCAQPSNFTVPRTHRSLGQLRLKAGHVGSQGVALMGRRVQGPLHLRKLGPRLLKAAQHHGLRQYRAVGNRVDTEQGGTWEATLHQTAGGVGFPALGRGP
jgi:hypothetical protein